MQNVFGEPKPDELADTAAASRVGPLTDVPSFNIC
jgi:hypothetical protein